MRLIKKIKKIEQSLDTFASKTEFIHMKACVDFIGRRKMCCREK
jgi:hypothetical protein